MSRLLWLRSVLVFLVAACPWAGSQTTATLTTADATLTFEADAAAPRLTELRPTNSPAWSSTTPDTLIPYAIVDKDQRPLQWHLNSTRTVTEAKRVAFVYETDSPALRLTWEWIARASFGPIEHQVRIENLTGSEIWLPLEDSFQFHWKVSPQLDLDHFYVEKGADTPSAVGTHRVPLTQAYRWSGLSSTYAHPKPGETREIIPWFLVERKDASASGWYVGIEFSGRTRLSLTRVGDSVYGAAGLNPNPGPFRTRLAPGATFETPTVFVGAFHDGTDSASNRLRQWVREVLGNPQTWKNPNYPLLVNNSWGSGMVIDEGLAQRMIRESAELELEMFHVDAGWFRGVGDWYPDPQKFPRGLAAIADDAHQHGLKFGLWVDWTQAGIDTEPGALNARDPKVRNWLVNDIASDWKPEEFKGQTTDLGVPAAKEWAQHEVERIVTDYRLDMIEHDGYLIAQGCTGTDHPHAPPNPHNQCVYHDSGADFVESSNATDVSYHAVRAYYDIYFKLRREHPDLMFEVCNDGGRMVDFGSAAHADYFSITDTYDPLSNRRAFYDTSWVLPSAMLETYVERWPTPTIENFRYMLRSGMMGWLTIMLDTTSWTKEQHDAAKEEIRLYKSALRPLIRDADLYHVSDRPDGVHWDGMEYFDARLRHGALYVFRGATETESKHTFKLRGLNPGSRYRLRFHDHTSPDQVVRGTELMRTGLSIPLAHPNSSEIVFFEEESATAARVKNPGKGAESE
jgi:alpha-galactosidase